MIIIFLLCQRGCDGFGLEGRKHEGACAYGVHLIGNSPDGFLDIVEHGAVMAPIGPS